MFLFRGLNFNVFHLKWNNNVTNEDDNGIVFFPQNYEISEMVLNIVINVYYYIQIMIK